MSTNHKQRQQAIFRYEAAKRIWITSNPSATCREYETAMRSIAEHYGV